VLRVARLTTVFAAVFGVALAILLGSVVDALTIFYTLLSVSLFVPVLAGLYVARASTPEALAAIGCGVATVLLVQFSTGGKGVAGLSPALLGLMAASVGFAIVYFTRTGFYGRQRAV
jgi:SSS family solute:Na+ symporter